MQKMIFKDEFGESVWEIEAESKQYLTKNN